MPKEFHSPNFWEEKYKANCCEHYEWLHSPSEIMPILREHLEDRKDARIL